ncbi:hypothetical protein ACFYXD_11410 [Streptomyces platensis]|uniref:hypothetical protein n=1 Tax=Streptomyces platensis TaxID=58346 RepID=UPI0036BCA521
MNGPGTGFGRTGDRPGDSGAGAGGFGPGPDEVASGRPVEDRLRRALAARAESIGIRDLRPAAPPRPAARRGPLSAVRRLWLRRFGLPLAAAAAAAAAVLGYLATAADGPPDRPLPARPPHSVGPSPDPAPRTPTSRPSPSAPSPDGPRTTAPSGAPPTTAPARPPRDRPTPTTTRPSGSPSGTAPPASAPPADTPAPQGGQRSNTPTATAS